MSYCDSFETSSFNIDDKMNKHPLETISVFFKLLLYPSQFDNVKCVNSKLNFLLCLSIKNNTEGGYDKTKQKNNNKLNHCISGNINNKKNLKVMQINKGN